MEERSAKIQKIQHYTIVQRKVAMRYRIQLIGGEVCKNTDHPIIHTILKRTRNEVMNPAYWWADKLSLGTRAVVKTGPPVGVTRESM